MGEVRLMAQFLVVDDEPIIAMTIADWLEDLGHGAVGPVADLPTALALAEQPLDAAILDVSLGAQTTLSVARRLAERGLPFLVATGHNPANIDAAFANGQVLSKPFGFESFRHAVERLLRRDP